MQIKRFEAVDMTEALRLVKREFGDDAVILSAKEIRQRGFFRALRKKRVEIRAATDYPMPEERKEDAFSGMLARQLDEASSADRVSLSTASEAPQAARTSRRPFVRHSGEASRPLERPGRDAAEMDSPHQPVDARPAFSAGPPAAGYAFAPSGRPETAVAARSTASACPWVVDPFFHGQTRRKVVAMVGTPGAGKSTCVAKLAWRCRAVDKKRVGLISLDRFRVAANSLLERVAGIMNLPLSVVYDAQSMQAALNRMDDVDVVLIDTPGICRSNASMMDDVCRLLRVARPDETHLVANAAIREELVAAMVERFSPAGVDRLLLTHWDENGSGSGSVIDRLETLRLPAAFYSDGVDPFDDLKTTCAELGRRRSPDKRDYDRVASFVRSSGHHRPAADVEPADDAAYSFLANRNSELFHQPACKSVKRINVHNIVAFDSIEAAIGEGFKPCRACCDIGMLRNSPPAAQWKQRASAI